MGEKLLQSFFRVIFHVDMKKMVSTTNILVKIYQFMRQIFAKPYEKSHEKNFTTLFLPLIDLQK